MKYLAAAVLTLSLPAAACPGLELADGWIREAPPGAAVMAGYARLRNSGPVPLTVATVRSAPFGAAELHRTLVENGVSRMLRGQTLPLAPGEAAALAPGGWHLMLFRPTRALRAGDTVPVTLGCGATEQTYDFPVKRQ